MEKKLSTKFGIKLNTDHFYERENLYAELIKFAMYHCDDNVRQVKKCVDMINELDSSFPFYLINDSFIEEIGYSIYCDDEIYEWIIEIFDHLKDIYTSGDYHKVVERTYYGLEISFGSHECNRKHVDPRLLTLMENIIKGPDYIDHKYLKGGEFAYWGYRYILTCMYAEAFILGRDNYDEINEKFKELSSIFDIREFAYIRGFGSSEDLENLHGDQRDKVYDYIFQYIREEYNRDRIQIR